MNEYFSLLFLSKTIFRHLISRVTAVHHFAVGFTPYTILNCETQSVRFPLYLAKFVFKLFFFFLTIPTFALQSSLPPNWQEVTDPSSGRKYYFNTVTRVTSWTIPTSAPVGPPSLPQPAAIAPPILTSAPSPMGMSGEWKEVTSPDVRLSKKFFVYLVTD